MRQVKEYNQKVKASKKVPALRSGDIVKVHRKIREGNKERIQAFEGIVVSVKGGQSSSPMVTLRRVAYGTGIELTIPLFSPAIQKIEPVKRARTRQAKLYYLRKKGFKLSKLKTKELSPFIAEEEKPTEENRQEADIPQETNSGEDSQAEQKQEDSK